jgi:hypothetical protein
MLSIPPLAPHLRPGLPLVPHSQSKITLEGADADIEINGVSLWTTMQEIANRLNIMQTNPELETEWAELRELGEQYSKLEQHIKDKQATLGQVKSHARTRCRLTATDQHAIIAVYYGKNE